MSELVWHYTVGQLFAPILDDGWLRPATAVVVAPEKPILWFSGNQDWEETANKLVGLPDGSFRYGSRETTRELGGGLVRFGYRRDRLHPWPKIARKAHMTAKTMAGLEAAARKAGSSPAEWYGTTRPIPLAQIKWVEVEENGKWVSVLEEEADHA